MPSYKPRITVYTDEITNEKLAYIAKAENRSSSNYTENLIKKAIKMYEQEYGEIIIDTEKKKDSTTTKILKSVTGVYVGEALGDMALEAIQKAKEKKENNSEN